MDVLSILTGSTKTLAALASLYKSCITIHNRFIVTKIEKFSQRPFNEKEVLDYIEEIGADRWEEIQDAIIHQLTQAESVIKALYERNLVEALLTKRITEDEFGRMNFILLHLYTYDIKELIQLYEGKECSEANKKTFAFYQLLNEDNGPTIKGTTLVIQKGFLLNDLGRKFVESIT